MRRALIGALALVALGAAACANINPTTTASANGRGPAHVFVAIGESGANESRGGPPDLRSQWTQIFYRSTLGTGSVQVRRVATERARPRSSPGPSWPQRPLRSDFRRRTSEQALSRCNPFELRTRYP
jgi:hypothetical protein